MAQGLRVWNADGSLQFDTASRLGRIIAVIATNGTDGSQTIAGISTAGGTVKAYMASIGTDCDPDVTISGNTVSWSYGNNTRTNRSKIVLVAY